MVGEAGGVGNGTEFFCCVAAAVAAALEKVKKSAGLGRLAEAVAGVEGSVPRELEGDGDGGA